MIFDSEKRLVDCCILIADCYKKTPNYERTGNVYKFSYNYSVPIEKIEEAMKFIAATFDHFGLNCSRVYISGFAVLTNTSVWTKERIVDQIKYETTKINMLLEDKQVVKSK